jgi:sugar fermentation stimulation protein A
VCSVRFVEPLMEARLLRRYQRVLADVEWPDGGVATVHCPNTGSMLGCCEPGSRVWLSSSPNPRRKYPLTWELVETDGGELVGINTQRTNTLVREALEGGAIPGLDAFTELRCEVPVGGSRSRIDFLLRVARGDYFLEVKNVTAAVSGRCALFPDAVSVRAARHARELGALCRSGHRAGMLFMAQRADVDEVRPADEIDPDYGQALRDAAAAGVDVFAYRARVSPREIAVERAVGVAL